MPHSICTLRLTCKGRKRAHANTFTAVQESLTRLTDSLDQVLDETMHLCRIPAPTFEEAERAAYVAERMRTIGLTGCPD